MDSIRCNRICPWEIESCGSIPVSNGLLLPGSKRTRFGAPPVDPEYRVPSRVSELITFILATSDRVLEILAKTCSRKVTRDL